MPPKKRKPIGQVQPKAKRIKLLRRRESTEERERRLARQRQRIRAARASETVEKREARLQGMRERVQSYRRSTRVQQRDSRLQNNTEGVRTPGRLDQLRIYSQAKRCQSKPHVMCCRNNKVKLRLLEIPPDEHLCFISGATLESKLSSGFQMTSENEPVMMISAGDCQLSSRSSQVDNPAPSQMSEEVKIETSGGGTSGSVGHAPLVEQQSSAVQMKLTPHCVKKEETPELNICKNENDLTDAPDGFSIKEEETEDNDYRYCEICKSYFFNKCEIHGPALITDAPVTKGVDDRGKLSSVWLKMSEEVKIETSGGTFGSVGHAPLVEQQSSAVQMKLTPLCVLEDCVKKEEKPDLNICESENDLNNVPDGSSVKEEETEDYLCKTSGTFLQTVPTKYVSCAHADGE